MKRYLLFAAFLLTQAPFGLSAAVLDDFNRLDSSTIGNGWSIVGGTATFSISAAALHISKNYVANVDRAEHAVNPGFNYVKIRIKTSSLAGGSQVQCWFNTGAYSISLNWHAGVVSVNGVTVESMTVSANTWYVMEYIIVDDKVDVFAAGIQRLSGVAMFADTTSPSVCLGVGGVFGSFTTDFDYVEVGYEGANVNSGLAAYYSFDGDARDSSGNGNDGTVIGPVPSTDRFGRGNSAYYFSGQGQRIEVADSPSLRPASVSVCAWVQPDDMDHWQIVVSKRYAPETPPFNSFILDTTWSDKPLYWRFCTSPGGVQGVTEGSAIETGKWAFIVGTDNGVRRRLYINGNLTADEPSGGSIAYSSMGLFIGSAPTFGSGFRGKIDEVSIYNRALSSSEIQSLYSGAYQLNEIKIADSCADKTCQNPAVNQFCGKSGTGSPIFVKSGDYRTKADDAVIPARGIPIQITRFYNSIEDYDGAFSYGWNFNYTIQLMRTATTNGGEQAVVRWANGVRKDFVLTNGVYRAPAGCYDTLTTNAAGFRLQMKAGMALLFNQWGFLTSQVDRHGNTLTFDYNLQNRLWKVTTADGRFITYSYGLHNGRVTNIADWAGRNWVYGYDARDDLVRVTYPDGGAVSYTYATNHQLTAIDDARNNRVSTLTYESNTTARATSYSEGSAVNFTMSYGSSSNLTVKTDSNGRVSRFAYNDYGNKTNWVNPAGHQLQFAWTSNQQINVKTDARGYQQFYQYDSRGNAVLTSNALGHVTRFAYETNFNKVTRIVDPLGNVVSNTYDSLGNLLTTRDARGFTAQYSYDSYGHVTNAVDTRGNSTVMAYDEYGNLRRTADPLGNTVSYEYDTCGNRVAVTDARGNAWTYGYDAMGRLTCSTNPLGQVTLYGYDANGNQTSITDARTNTVWLFYDAYNRLIATSNALGHVARMGYDSYGNATWTRDPLGNVSSNSYDILNRLVRTTDPLGNLTRFSYDPNGNRVAVTDAMDNVTRYGFDPLNRKVAMTNALGAVWRYQYDANGNLVAVTDSMNHSSFSAYDVRNMVTNSANALGHSYRYEYDGNGNAVRRIDPNGAALDYSYDAANRLTEIAYPDGGRLAFAYDPNGNVLSLSNATETVRYAYDALNRVTNVFVVGLNKTVGYEYDAAGNRAAMSDPDGGRTEYAYDALNRLTDLRDPADKTWTFTYDALNRMTGMAMPNGIAAAYLYDVGSRLTNLTYRTSANAVLQSFVYAYDAVGNPLRVQREDNLFEVYGYDKTYQLTNVFYDASTVTGAGSTNWTSYMYDLVGNRLMLTRPGYAETYQYDAANRMLSVTSAMTQVTFLWDNNGNMVRKTENGTNTLFAWDCENKLVTITYHDGRTNAFAYYPSSSLRHTKTDSAGICRYVYDGQNELQQLDGLGTLVAQYTYSLGIDSLLARTAGGSRQYYLRDMIGSVTAVADPDQNLLATYRYDAFGTVRRQTGAADNPYLFTARALDQDSGLYYYRARYLSSSSASFVSLDPMMQDNGYGYALNRPTFFVDPKGEIAFAALAIPAVLGGIAGGGFYIVTAGDSFTGSGLAGATTGGAIGATVGAIALASAPAVAGVGAIAAIGAGAGIAAGAAGYAVDRSVQAFGQSIGLGEAKKASYEELGFSMAVGGVAGAAGNVVNSVLQSAAQAGYAGHAADASANLADARAIWRETGPGFAGNVHAAYGNVQFVDIMASRNLVGSYIPIQFAKKGVETGIKSILYGAHGSSVGVSFRCQGVVQPGALDTTSPCQP